MSYLNTILKLSSGGISGNLFDSRKHLSNTGYIDFGAYNALSNRYTLADERGIPHSAWDAGYRSKDSYDRDLRASKYVFNAKDNVYRNMGLMGNTVPWEDLTPAQQSKIVGGEDKYDRLAIEARLKPTPLVTTLNPKQELKVQPKQELTTMARSRRGSGVSSYTVPTGINTKDFLDFVMGKDKLALGRWGVDGKWGKMTNAAWQKYGEEYLKFLGDKKNQDAANQNQRQWESYAKSRGFKTLDELDKIKYLPGVNDLLADDRARGAMGYGNNMKANKSMYQHNKKEIFGSKAMAHNGITDSIASNLDYIKTLTPDKINNLTDLELDSLIDQKRGGAGGFMKGIFGRSKEDKRMRMDLRLKLMDLYNAYLKSLTTESLAYKDAVAQNQKITSEYTPFSALNGQYGNPAAAPSPYGAAPTLSTQPSTQEPVNSFKTDWKVGATNMPSIQAPSLNDYMKNNNPFARKSLY